MSLPQRVSEDDKIIRFAALKALMEEKFPDAVGQVEPDAALENGGTLLPPGLLTEVTGSSGSVSLLLHALLNTGTTFAGLVDAADTFDPAEIDEEHLRRLLWVRCNDIGMAVQAVDMLLRDGNLPLIILDLRRITVRELRSVPTSTWHRFQRILETGETALGICTLQACIPAARLRWQLAHRWTLRDLLRPREELQAEVHIHAMRRGFAPAVTERRIA